MFYDRVYFGKELVKAIIKKKKNKGGTKSKRKTDTKKKRGRGVVEKNDELWSTVRSTRGEGDEMIDEKENNGRKKENP
jgi:hypothetical protein